MSKTRKRQANFYLREETLDALQTLADEKGESRSETIALALHIMETLHRRRNAAQKRKAVELAAAEERQRIREATVAHMVSKLPEESR